MLLSYAILQKKGFCLLQEYALWGDIALPMPFFSRQRKRNCVTKPAVFCIIGVQIGKFPPLHSLFLLQLFKYFITQVSPAGWIVHCDTPWDGVELRIRGRRDRRVTWKLSLQSETLLERGNWQVHEWSLLKLTLYCILILKSSSITNCNQLGSIKLPKQLYTNNLQGKHHWQLLLKCSFRNSCNVFKKTNWKLLSFFVWSDIYGVRCGSFYRESAPRVMWVSPSRCQYFHTDNISQHLESKYRLLHFLQSTIAGHL